MKIHVCLVSDQPIPNLTTVLQFKPDKVVLLKRIETSVFKQGSYCLLRNKIMRVLIFPNP